MADDDENEIKQKRLEAKRTYNRLLAARNRQRTKDEISTLTANVEFHKDRADKLEKKNAELLDEIQVLSVANRILKERLQLLEQQQQQQQQHAGFAASAAAIQGGPTCVGPSTTMHNAGSAVLESSSAIRQPDLSIFGSGSNGSGGNGSLDSIDQRYQELTGFLSGIPRGGSGGIVSDPLSSMSGSPLDQNAAAASLPPNDRLTNLLAQELSIEEMDCLIRLVSTRNHAKIHVGNDRPHSSQGAEWARQGISDTGVHPATSSTIDSLAQLLLHGPSSRVAAAAPATPISVSVDTRDPTAQLRRQQIFAGPENRSRLQQAVARPTAEKYPPQQHQQQRK
jgi:hypothetical protein